MFAKLKQAGNLLKEAVSEGAEDVKNSATAIASDAKNKVSNLATTTYTIKTNDKDEINGASLETVITICASHGIIIEKETKCN
jgi:hypothetical protein